MLIWVCFQTSWLLGRVLSFILNLSICITTNSHKHTLPLQRLSSYLLFHQERVLIMESNYFMFSIHTSHDPPEQISPGHSKILSFAFEVAKWPLFGLGVWVLLGFFLVLPKLFLLYIESQGCWPFWCLVFCLSHVHNLDLRENVQGDVEYTVVYLETKYIVN